MIELRVSATDGLFSAVTQIYTSWESLNEFAYRLRGFPRTTLDIVEDTNGQIGGYSYFRVLFRCKDDAGHAAVEIEMGLIPEPIALETLFPDSTQRTYRV